MSNMESEMAKVWGGFFSGYDPVGQRGAAIGGTVQGPDLRERQAQVREHAMAALTDRTRIEMLHDRMAEVERAIAEGIGRLSSHNDRMLGPKNTACGATAMLEPTDALLPRLEYLNEQILAKVRWLHDEIDRACEVG